LSDQAVYPPKSSIPDDKAVHQGDVSHIDDRVVYCRQGSLTSEKAVCHGEGAPFDDNAVSPEVSRYSV
jgi:hypothetical protein